MSACKCCKACKNIMFGVIHEDFDCSSYFARLDTADRVNILNVHACKQHKQTEYVFKDWFCALHLAV